VKFEMKASVVPDGEGRLVVLVVVMREKWDLR
jgi:hypothetical protein